MRRIKTVTVFGSSKPKEGQSLFKEAFCVGKSLAEAGYRVVNGGGPGTMLATTLGAKDAKGKTAVVYYSPEYATSFEGKATVNLADESYEEANYIFRTKRLLELGDAYVCMNGGTGTLSEFGMAWGLARLYFGHHKPLILYGEFWNNIIETIQKNMIPQEEEYKVFKIVNTCEGMVRALEQFEIMIRLQRHTNPKCLGDECSFML